MTEEKEIGVGILGLGTVGQSVLKILQANQDLLSRRLGATLKIWKIAVRELEKERMDVQPQADWLTTSIDEVIRHPKVDIVVELMGGLETARYAVVEALNRDKQVVSANKALVATHGEELFELAQSKQRDFLFEASVAGGIPILRTLREAFVGNRIRSLLGIVNGTSNYILSEMARAVEEGSEGSFLTFLEEAQKKGYAEADPTLDIDGTDAVQKLAILASLAFGHWIDYRTIYREGINHLQMIDFSMARDFGYRIKLLAIAKDGDAGLDVRVHPTLVPQRHLLATIDGVFNAIYIDGDPLGPTLFYGQGAGGGPTATAVVSDIVDAGRNLLASSLARVPILSYAAQPMGRLTLSNMDHLVSRYYLRLSVVDRPGALAMITQILGQNQISISAMNQKERNKAAPVAVVLLTHHAKEREMRAAMAELDQLEVVVDRSVCLRIED